LDEKLSAKEDAAKKAITDRQDKMKETDDQKKKDDAHAKEMEGVKSLARKIFEKRVTELLGKSGASSGTNAVPSSASAPAAEPKK
jgi:DNA replication initiation complex subunit (GINS family)